MIIEFILTVFSLCVLALITGWYHQYFKHKPHFFKYNGPTPIPIFGNIFRITSSLDIIPVMMEYHKKFGPLIALWFGFSPRLTISDYRAAEHLLRSNTIIDKSYDYNFFHAWLGTGLLTSTGSKWKRQRKLLTPTFHFQILEQYISIFNGQGDVLLQKLQKHVETGAFDIYPYINLCSLDIICEAAMGIQIEAQKGKANDYANAVTEVTEIILRRSFSPIKQFDFIFNLSQDSRLQKRALEKLHKHTNYVIKSRQEELKGKHKIDVNENGAELLGIKKRMAFLDLLLQCRVDGKPLPLENVREEVDTFMFEGHDTTTAAMCFTLYCLSQHSHIQNKVFQELNQIFNNDKFVQPTYTELQQMSYLEMVLKESMRLYPPVPIFSRNCPTYTELDGNVFRKGTTFTMFLYGLHRQEEMFPDPEKFDPERFTPENCLKRNPYAYVPFSAGPRNCIGQRFAMLELKSVVSKIIRHFEVLPAPGYKPLLTPDAILRSANGIQLGLKKRT